MTITETAPAKLNLTLEVLGRRPDGYHDMQMVMQTVSLADTVTVRTDTGTGEIRVSTDREDLPGGPDNLAWKAADAFFRETGTRCTGLDIHLAKRIPMQAGMGGGSADGAAVLRALRAAYRPELTGEELERIGALVGSDVPFCVRGGTALAEGRGERLRDLPAMPVCPVLICKPDFGLSTPALFRRLDGAQPDKRPDLPAMLRALEEANTASVAEQLCNVFDAALTGEEAAVIRDIRDAMLLHGAMNSVMTGSGPTVFGLFPDRESCGKAAEALRQWFSQVFLAEPVGPSV